MCALGGQELLALFSCRKTRTESFWTTCRIKKLEPYIRTPSGLSLILFSTKHGITQTSCNSSLSYERKNIANAPLNWVVFLSSATLNRVSFGAVFPAPFSAIVVGCLWFRANNTLERGSEIGFPHLWGRTGSDVCIRTQPLCAGARGLVSGLAAALAVVLSWQLLLLLKQNGSTLKSTRNK